MNILSVSDSCRSISKAATTFWTRVLGPKGTRKGQDLRKGSLNRYYVLSRINMGFEVALQSRLVPTTGPRAV